MKKETLVKKWLDNELTAEELLEFQQLDSYESYMKLSQNVQFFKAPNFDTNDAFGKLKPIIEQKREKKKKTQRFTFFAKIAAVFLIGFSMYSLIFSNQLTTIDTLASQKTTVVLPDNSIADLNSLSKIKYNRKSWEKNRKVDLEGEAYFKVAKGSRFDVKTSEGIVSVLGTQFNVKNREDYFEVKCFEGRVSVAYKDQVMILTIGKTFRVIKGVVSNESTDLIRPTWMDNFSSFKSIPLSEVIAEFERQYAVQISTSFDKNVLFTGAFVHDNKEQALKSITLPFGLEYTIHKNKITFEENH